jgi:hypothetical protein
VAAAVHSMTNNSMFYVFVMMWMWVLLAGEVSGKRLRSLKVKKQIKVVVSG